MPERRLVRVAILSFALSLAGCSRSLKIENPYVARLNNQGLVALSEDNPYLAGNLLLTKESESSIELRGFLEHRGQPTALEVKKSLFSPLRVELFYPDTREYFIVEEAMATWAIRGPFPLSSQRLREVLVNTNRLRDDLGEAPLSEGEPPYVVTDPPGREIPRVDGRTSRAGFSSPSTDDEPPDLNGDLNPRDRRGASRTSADDAPLVPPPRPGSNRPKDFDPEMAPLRRQLEIAEGKPAELSPRGDLVHYVTYPGENLSMIAQWYTFEKGNASKIARINKITSDTPLREGDTIVVPSYLLKNKNRMTEDAVRSMRIMTEGDGGR